MPPVVELHAPGSTDAENLSRLSREIGGVCRDVGFFYVSRHGLEASIEPMFAWSRRFFALPAADKAALAISAASDNCGYVGLDTEALDPGAPVDCKEAFNIRLDPASPAEADAAYWPRLDGFRAAMRAYFVDVYRLGLDIHRAIAVDLGLAPTYFDPLLQNPMATLRLLHYPPLPDVAGRLGAGAHTDYGNLTILLTDDAGGLQARRRDGTWIDVPYIPGAFVCNIGDCLMRWSNDYYVSTPHRVISPAGRERYSIAFFLDPNAQAMVEPLPACVSADRPALYPPITAGDYFASRFAATYGFDAKPST